MPDIQVNEGSFERITGSVTVDRATFSLAPAIDPKWTSETCGTCAFFRRAVGAEIEGFAGTCRESSIRQDGFPRTTDGEPACRHWSR